MPEPATRTPRTSATGDLYLSRPPWDTGAPQPAFAALASSGAFRGRVLDAGCGTGEHTLLAAAAGLDATGIDLSVTALRTARDKARTRGLTVRFLRCDVLRLAGLGEVFGTALDSLVMHAFDAAARSAYLEGLHTVLAPGGRLFVLCYSDRHTSQPAMPHATSRAGVESWFSAGWRLDRLEPTTCATNLHPDGVAAWLAAVTRT